VRPASPLPRLAAGAWLVACVCVPLAVSAVGASAQTDTLISWGAEPPGILHGERPRTFDLRHQIVHVRFDWARHAVVGSTTITVGALAGHAGVREVALDAVGMHIGSVTSASGAALQHEYDGKMLTVKLASALRVERPTTFTIAYETVHPKKGAYFIDRRHIVVIADDVLGGKQPFHHAKRMGLAKAEKYLADYITNTDRLAREALEKAISELEAQEFSIHAAAIVLASGRGLPPLPQILAAHPLIHTAEGELFRQTVRRACESLRIPVMGYHERDLKQSKEVPAKTIQFIQGAGKFLGPPWTADHKCATLAACLALSERTRNLNTKDATPPSHKTP